MRVAIAGGTGFVGKALTKRLLQLGHEVIILTRDAKKYKQEHNLTYVEWLNGQPISQSEGVEAFVNLAGQSINTRWTTKNKKKIVESRLSATEQSLSFIKSMPSLPKIFINASAIGYYGTSLTETFTENSPIKGTDFLATTVQQWEQKAQEVIEELSIRTVFCRFGLILDHKEGALPKMVLPYQLFVGGKMGLGKQWMSWIHIDDVVDGIIFAIEHNDLSGPVNFTAPNPVTMDELGRAISKQLHRPHWFPVPTFLLRLALGEMSILILEGQKVLPRKLIDAGYSFKYKTIDDALAHLYIQ